MVIKPEDIRKVENLRSKLPKFKFFLKLFSDILQYVLLMTLIFRVLIFPILSHPLGIGVVILYSTVCVASLMGLQVNIFWLSYSLVLVILGGLLVIFIYVSLLSSNEIFKPKNSKTILFMLFLSLLASSLAYSTDYLKSYTGWQALLGEKSTRGKELLAVLYSRETWLLVLFLVLYLLVTLVIVVYITRSDGLALRASGP